MTLKAEVEPLRERRFSVPNVRMADDSPGFDKVFGCEGQALDQMPIDDRLISAAIDTEANPLVIRILYSTKYLLSRGSPAFSDPERVTRYSYLRARGSLSWP